MKFAFSLCVLFAVACLVRCDLDSEWEKYKVDFNKNYDAHEEALRKDIFSKNLDAITEHNKLYDEGKTTYTMGINQFTDWTRDEFNGMLMHNNSDARKDSIDAEWETYKAQFNKKYETKEDSLRKEIFRKNLELITEHNKKYEAGETTFTMGLNNFSDWTFEEIKKMF